MINNKFIKFFNKGVFFITGFIIVTLLLHLLLIFCARNIDVGEYGTLNKIHDGNINAEILICGSSRALKAVNPDEVSKNSGLSCYNIASDGADLGVQLPKLKWYLSNNVKPKLIIQDVSQFYGGISKTIFEPFKYLPYFSNDSLYQGLLKLDEDLWLHKYFPPSNLIFYNFDFYLKIFRELYNSTINEEPYINGHLPDSSKWSSDFDTFVKENPNGISTTITKEYKSYMNELKSYCKKEKIVLVLTALPNYYMMANQIKDSDKLSRFYTSLTNHNVKFFNFVYSEISKNEDNFYNFTHLNSTGALAFSKLLADSLKGIKNFE